jgi:hypothetical protein
LSSGERKKPFHVWESPTALVTQVRAVSVGQRKEADACQIMEKRADQVKTISARFFFAAA